MANEARQNTMKDFDLTPDWTQIHLNGGPPCFAVMGDDKRFCNRAERWEGHPSDHKFVSWTDFLFEVMMWGYSAHESAIRTAAAALVAALTKEPDDYDGLVYYEYAKELSNLQEALSHGWLARKEANPMCKCGVPLYLHGSLTACCLPRMTADDRERESLIGALQDRSRLDPDAPNALVVATDKKEAKWLHNHLKK